MSEAKALFADQSYKVEIIERVEATAATAGQPHDDIDDLERPPGSIDATEVSADGVISVYRNSDEFVDMCVGPARAVHGSARTFQAAEGGRCVLARQREGPDAAAHLRHGLGIEAGARRSPAPTGGSRQARPSQAGRRARPAELPVDARWRARRVAPEGRHDPQADGGLQQGAPREGWLLVRVHAAPGQRRSCSRRRATSGSTPTACIRRWRWTTARTTRSR